jgi:hypothetical protein
MKQSDISVKSNHQTHPWTFNYAQSKVYHKTIHVDIIMEHTNGEIVLEERNKTTHADVTTERISGETVLGEKNSTNNNPGTNKMELQPLQ